MRRLLALTILLALAVPAHAADPPFLAAVQQGDAELGLDLHKDTSGRMTIGYLDANGNGHPDTQPNEMLYLDLDGSGSVTYGDLRLSPFDTYAAGTVVDLTNRDVGRTLAPLPNAWFAQSAGGAWFLDADNSKAVSVGDIAFGAAPAKVMPGDSRIGQALTAPSASPSNSYGWTTTGRDVAKAFYIDIDAYGSGSGANRVSVGDLRVTPVGLAPDGAPTRAEFEQAQKDAAARQEQQQQTVVQQTTSSKPSAWRALDWFVVGLAVLNLAGLVAIARRVNQLRGPPKNPFK